MLVAKLRAKALVRGAVRRLVPIVSQRPWLVAIAARAFVVVPSLKLRLRRMVSVPEAAIPITHERRLTDAETRVRMDLRAAAALRAERNRNA